MPCDVNDLDFGSALDCSLSDFPDGFSCKDLTADNINQLLAVIFEKVKLGAFSITAADCDAGTITITDGETTCTIGGGGGDTGSGFEVTAYDCAAGTLTVTDGTTPCTFDLAGDPTGVTTEVATVPIGTCVQLPLGHIMLRFTPVGAIDITYHFYNNGGTDFFVGQSAQGVIFTPNGSGMFCNNRTNASPEPRLYLAE